MSDAADEVCERIAAAAREVAFDFGCIETPEFDNIERAFERFADLLWKRPSVNPAIPVSFATCRRVRIVSGLRQRRRRVPVQHPDGRPHPRLTTRRGFRCVRRGQDASNTAIWTSSSMRCRSHSRPCSIRSSVSCNTSAAGAPALMPVARRRTTGENSPLAAPRAGR